VPIDASALFRGRVCDHLDLDHCVSAKLSPLTWKINGQRATPLFGEPPEGAMLPVTSPPVELVPTGSPAAVVEDDKQKAVIDYLANLREMVEAQRQVMLAYLGASEVKVVAAEPVIEIDVDEQADSDQAEVASASEAAVDVGPMLLEIVSERTGYPIEMLDLDQDLESDLSIDSIKRIEILGVLNDRSGLAAKLGGGDQDELVEELASIKTLRGIIEWLERHAGDVEEKQVVTGPVVEQESKEHAEPLPDKVSRFVFEIERVAPAQRNGLVLSDKVIALTRDDSGIAEVLAAVLEKAGARVHWASADTPIVEVDGLVHLASLRSSGGPEEVKALFRHAKLAVGGGAKWIIGVTGMGGLFGRASNGSGRLGQGGVSGLLKTLAKEYPKVRSRAIDVDPSEDANLLARIVVDEMLADDDDVVEVGYREGQRHVMKVVPDAHEMNGEGSAGESLGIDSLSRDAVVLVTGGARGITARVAIEIAQASRCHLELVGRTPLANRCEDPITAAAEDSIALKRLLIERRPEARLAEIEGEARKILAAREIRSTLRMIEEAGATVRYQSVDVRDGEVFGQFIESIYERHDRIDAVIHGAGVLEDKLIAHKTQESFDRVFDTKVSGAMTLADKLRDDVRVVVFFSSVSGAFGNRGQVDYAAANDVLDKLAHYLNERSTTRFLSVNWGPWDSVGMVSPELRAEYDRRGVGLISLSAGASSLIEELGRGSKEDAQVILMNADPAVMV